MKSLVSFAALFILLTPALAQQYDQPASAPDRQDTTVTSQPYNDQPGMSQPVSQSGMSQADAVAAAQDAEEQSAQGQGEQSGEQSSAQSNAQQYPDPDQQPYPDAQQQNPPPAAEPSHAQPYGAERGREQREDRPYDQNAGQQGEVDQPYGQNTAQQPPVDRPYDQNAAPYPPVVRPNDQPDADRSDPDNPPARSERRTLPVSPVVRPRAEAAAYPAYRQQAQLSVGARLLSPREVEQKFSTPLGKHYLVVEVGVFPAVAVELRPQDFTLRAGNDDQAFFPSAPEEIAIDLAAARPRRVRVFPSVGIGYESGPWGRGLSTGVGVGVDGQRPYPRGPMGANRRVIEIELRDKSLPEGSLTEPVAGYLYFPVKLQRNVHYNLELTRNGQVLSLPLPAPRD